MSEEALVVGKVEELMAALDQVKRYRALTRLLVDFLVIILVSVVVMFFWELAVNLYKIGTGYYCFYGPPMVYTCTASLATGSHLVQTLAGVSLLAPTAALLGGVYWVDRKLKSVEVGEWKESLREGFPGAVKLLQEMKWDSILDDIRASKIGYTVYFLVKVIGYWVFAFIVLFFPYVLGISFLHVELNLYILAFLSLGLVLVLSRNDLQKKYNQVLALDSLMFELRWFSDGFKSAKFET
jgi:hypothetical protein